MILIFFLRTLTTKIYPQNSILYMEVSRCWEEESSAILYTKENTKDNADSIVLVIIINLYINGSLC